MKTMRAGDGWHSLKARVAKRQEADHTVRTSVAASFRENAARTASCAEGTPPLRGSATQKNHGFTLPRGTNGRFPIFVCRVATIRAKIEMRAVVSYTPVVEPEFAGFTMN